MLLDIKIRQYLFIYNYLQRKPSFQTSATSVGISLFPILFEIATSLTTLAMTSGFKVRNS